MGNPLRLTCLSGPLPGAYLSFLRVSPASLLPPHNPSLAHPASPSLCPMNPGHLAIPLQPPSSRPPSPWPLRQFLAPLQDPLPLAVRVSEHSSCDLLLCWALTLGWMETSGAPACTALGNAPMRVAGCVSSRARTRALAPSCPPPGGNLSLKGTWEAYLSAHSPKLPLPSKTKVRATEADG